MGRRNDHSRDEIREMAIVAATAVIETRGLDALSARGIATDIGYTVGTLYQVFANLDDLIVNVNGRTLEALHDALEASIADVDDACDRVLAIAHAYMNYAMEHHSRWSAVYDHRLPAGESVPAWFDERVHRSFALVASAVGGALPAATPAQISSATQALWGGVHGVCVLALNGKLETTQPSGSLVELVDTLARSFLDGWKPAWGQSSDS